MFSEVCRFQSLEAGTQGVAWAGVGTHTCLLVLATPPGYPPREQAVHPQSRSRVDPGAI